MEENEILMENQYGFRRGLFRDMAVLKLVDWINDEFQAAIIPATVFLEMRKALNTVDHSELIQAWGEALSGFQHIYIIGIR